MAAKKVLQLDDESLSLVRSALEMKREALQASLRWYQKRLETFEQANGMSGETFLARFRSGELGDEEPWFEWEYLLDTAEAVKGQLVVLERIRP